MMDGDGTPIEPCILAGCPLNVCAVCGVPWKRVMERAGDWNGEKYGVRAVAASGGAISGGTAKSTLGSSRGKGVKQTVSSELVPGCSCDHTVIPGVVLDPFGGAGTTGLVAAKHERSAVLIELSPSYSDLARQRIAAADRAAREEAGDTP